MPSYQPKEIQKELDSNLFWPFYMLVGNEALKSREVIKRILKAGKAEEGFGPDYFDGGEVDAHAILDSAQTMGFGGGPKFVVIRNFHQLKSAEVLAPLFGSGKKSRQKLEDTQWICIAVSNDLDKRKKFSKLVVDQAACVDCGPVADADRIPWIQYLAKHVKRHSISAISATQATQGNSTPLKLSPEQELLLSQIEPFNLDSVNQELEKLALSPESDSSAVTIGSNDDINADRFIHDIFERNAKGALLKTRDLAASPDTVFPLIGLLTWNIRQLVTMKTSNAGAVRVPPFILDRLKKWAREWDHEALVALNHDLEQIDYSLKQTPRMGMALWDNLIMKHCG
jgi:DNA polymerase III delta subunit